LMSIVSLVIAPHLHKEIKHSERLQKQLHERSMITHTIRVDNKA